MVSLDEGRRALIDTDIDRDWERSLVTVALLLETCREAERLDSVRLLQGGDSVKDGDRLKDSDAETGADTV